MKKINQYNTTKVISMNQYKTILQLFLLAIIAITLAACGTMSSGGKTRASINIQSAQYLNPNINGEPAPVRITFYELRSPFTFRQTSYQELINNSNQILGSDLIDMQTIEMRPNSRRSVTLNLSDNTEYLGVIAGFREIEQADWQALVEIIPETRNVIVINLESQGLTIKSNTKINND